MRLRSVALGLALVFGFTAAAEARSNPNPHFRKSKKWKAPKAPKYKQRKIKHT